MTTATLSFAAAQPARNALLEWVDFKWLMMATEGERIDVQRTQGDRGYAQTCVERGLRSRSEVMRRCAARLRARLIPASA
jgi:hypothetical protein